MALGMSLAMLDGKEISLSTEDPLDIWILVLMESVSIVVPSFLHGGLYVFLSVW